MYDWGMENTIQPFIIWKTGPARLTCHQHPFPSPESQPLASEPLGEGKEARCLLTFTDNSIYTIGLPPVPEYLTLGKTPNQARCPTKVSMIINVALQPIPESDSHSKMLNCSLKWHPLK